jgi:hypothetical protein
MDQRPTEVELQLSRAETQPLPDQGSQGGIIPELVENLLEGRLTAGFLPLAESGTELFRRTPFVVGPEERQHFVVLLEQVAPGELGAAPELLEGAGIPACLDATLEGPVLVDAARLLLFAIEDAVPGLGSLPDLDQLFQERAGTALDVQVDGFTRSQGVELPRREKTLRPEAYVFKMEGGASAATAFATAKAVRPDGVGDLDQAG